MRGFWKETLFPAIKDLARYGADAVLNTNKLEDMIAAAVDAAVLSLGTLQPELMPMLEAAGAFTKPKATASAVNTMNRIRDWTMRGL